MWGDYTFPVLEVEKIDKFFTTIADISVSADDLKKPQACFVQKLYKACLEELLGVNIEQVCQPSFDDLSKLEYPTIHENAIYLRNFVLALRWVLGKCALETFTIRDLVDPKPKPTRRYLSGLINFYHLRFERQAVYEKLKNERESEIEQISNLKKANEEIKKKINAIKAHHAEQEPEVKKVEAEIQKMEETLEQDQKQQNLLRTARDEYQAKLQEVNALMDQKKLTIAQLQEERQEVAAKIVQSPDRVKREQENMYAQQEDLKAQKKETSERLIETQKRFTQLAEWLNDFESCNRMLQNLSEQVSQERECAKKVTKVQEERHEHHTNMQQLLRKEELLSQQIDKKQNKLSKQRILHKKKMAEIEEELQKLKEEEENLLRLQSEEQGEILATKESIKETEARGEEAVRQETLMTDNMKAKLKCFKEELDSYHTKLHLSSEKAFSLLEEN